MDTKDLKWIRGHNYAPVSATWAIKYAPVYYTGLFWIRGYPTVQTAHCAVDYQRVISGLSVGYQWVISGLSVGYQWVISRLSVGYQ